MGVSREFYDINQALTALYTYQRVTRMYSFIITVPYLAKTQSHTSYERNSLCRQLSQEVVTRSRVLALPGHSLVPELPHVRWPPGSWWMQGKCQDWSPGKGENKATTFIQRERKRPVHGRYYERNENCTPEWTWAISEWVMHMVSSWGFFVFPRGRVVPKLRGAKFWLSLLVGRWVLFLIRSFLKYRGICPPVPPMDSWCPFSLEWRSNELWECSLVSFTSLLD